FDGLIYGGARTYIAGHAPSFASPALDRPRAAFPFGSLALGSSQAAGPVGRRAHPVAPYQGFAAAPDQEPPALGDTDRVRHPVSAAAAAEVPRGLLPRQAQLARGWLGAGGCKAARSRRHRLRVRCDTRQAFADGVVPPDVRLVHVGARL